MVLFVLFIIGLVFIPASAEAWGPITHVYLGSEVLSLASLLPAGVYALLKQYRQDYLYGNLMADIILAKKYLPVTENSHSWEIAFELMDSAERPEEKAFVYGYMSHLAADTVAHEWVYERPGRHAFLELSSEGMIGRRYWLMAITIDRRVQRRHDLFLENNLKSPIISVKTCRRIFKGMVFLAGLTPRRIVLLTDRRFSHSGSVYSTDIRELHRRSVERIIDILKKGECSKVIGISPVC